MERSLEEIEIKWMVWDLSTNKAPGPNGFTFVFFQQCWDIVKDDIQMFSMNFISMKDSLYYEIPLYYFYT